MSGRDGPVEVPRVTVIVPCRNERAHIGACLDSIEASTYPRHCLEVLVIDGMSDDGTREILAARSARGGVRWLDNEGRTAPAALNIGVREAHGEIIVRMDAHTVYPPDYIERLVYWLLRSGADNVGGRWLTRPGADTAIARAIAAGLSHPVGVGNAHFRLSSGEPRWVDTVPFGCYRREVFERIGMFDEDLVRNQDDEFNARLIGKGGRILLVPAVAAAYQARPTLRTLWKTYYQFGLYRPLAIQKLGRIPTVRQIVPPLFVATMGAAAMAGAVWPSARPIGAALGGAYALVLGAAAVDVARRHGLLTGILVIPVFAVLHHAYGFGFLAGMLHRLARRPLRDGRAIPLSR